MDRHQKLQKMIITIEFTALDLCTVQNFIKTEAFAFFIQSYGLKVDRCKHWQVSRITENDFIDEFSIFKLHTKQNFVENG